MCFWLITTGHRTVTEDVDISKYGREKVSICNFGERWEVVLGCIQILHDEPYSAVLLPDYGVVVIFVSLDGADQMPDMAESPLEAFFECCYSLPFKRVSNSTLFMKNTLWHQRLLCIFNLKEEG
jgi:hypothetical protein